jgi:hypothetical protein
MAPRGRFDRQAATRRLLRHQKETHAGDFIGKNS